MTDASLPFAEKKFTEVSGHRMAYIDESEGAPIVFQHGNPTSSYLWRNVMPACRGLGRLIACDLIGMGDSDKLYPSGPDRYTYADQRDFLFALWDNLKKQKKQADSKGTFEKLRVCPISQFKRPSDNENRRRLVGVASD